MRWAALLVIGHLALAQGLASCKSAPPPNGQVVLYVDTDAPREKLDQLLKLTERYCVVYQTIRNGPPVDVSLGRN